MVERVFQKLALAFGNQVSAKWGGMNMQDVYQDWADALRDCSLGAINYGIEQSKKDAHPPSQGEFVKHCQQYQPAQLLKLESKLSPEQIEKNRARIAEITKSLSMRKQA